MVRRSTDKAVHTQGTVKTKWCTNKAIFDHQRSLVIKGWCKGWPARRAKRVVCGAQPAERAGGGGGGFAARVGRGRTRGVRGGLGGIRFEFIYFEG